MPSVTDAAIRIELRKLLAALYPTEHSQRRLAAEAKLTIGAIPFGGSAYDAWHQILHHAAHNQALGNLLRLALDDFPDNEPLQQLASGQASTLLDGPGFVWRGPSNAKGLLEQVVSGKPALVDVAHLAVGLQKARAVVKVVRPDGGTGTGFVIPNQRLITNHHVLPDASCAAGSGVVFNYQRATEGFEEATQTMKLAPEVYFQTDEEDDFTVVGIQGETGSRWGSIELSRRTPARGDLVNIIQHPGGGPKQVGLSFDVVAFVGEGRLQYLTDTLPGASGSPVFDRDWNVVALHHSGGWLVEPGSADKRIYYRNQGILIDRILDKLH